MNLKTLRSLAVSALITAIMVPAALAQFSSPVKVTNAADTPVPVRDTRQTSSAGLRFNQGDSIVTINPAVPTCPNGSDFLITALTAAPDLIFTPDYPAGAWGVAVNVVQNFQGGAVARSISVFGSGAQHASVTLPAGQPGFGAGRVVVWAKLLSGPSQGNIWFNIHISGYCGVAFVSPNQQ